MTVVDRLHATILAVCPITGVFIGTVGVSSSVRIDFAAGATQTQQQAAQAALDSFDWSDAAQQTWEDQQEPDLSGIIQQAQNAINANDTYLAIASPTNAQVVAQVRALTQQNSKIIRAVVRLIRVEVSGL